MPSYLRNLIGECNYSMLAGIPLSAAGERHPTWSAIYYAENNNDGPHDRTLVSNKIEGAIRKISERNEQWLSEIRHRLVVADFDEAASALGEIRAFSALIEAYGNMVSPVPRARKGRTPSPDFVIENNDRFVYVEVATKRVNAEMAKRIAAEQDVARKKSAKDAEEARKTGLKGSVSVHSYIVEPFGVGKVGDRYENGITNAISKICAIKQRGHQFRRSHPVILWIDLQDQIFWPHDSTAALPLYGCAGGNFCSGSYWYAFYGEKGMPLFYIESFIFPKQDLHLKHNGKFGGNDGEHLSAAVLSLVNETIIFENHRAKHPLNRWFRWLIPNLPRFDAGRSFVNWSEDDALKKKIDASKKEINALHSAFSASRKSDWPW